MAFTEFKNLGQILRLHDISVQKKNFITATPQEIPARLVEDVDFVLKYVNYDSSEAAICENLIYPVLFQVWKRFLDTLALHSHRTWQVDASLTGIPDYLISAVSKYGGTVIDTPVLVAIEAKKDDFEGGWGQCAAEMVAAQRTNQNNDLTIYGLVSNGEQWEFGALNQSLFTQSITAYSIFDLDKLYSALYFVLADCKNQLNQNKPQLALK
jgi:hypothetical protein